MVRTLHSHGQGPGFSPGQGTRIPQAGGVAKFKKIIIPKATTNLKKNQNFIYIIPQHIC